MTVNPYVAVVESKVSRAFEGLNHKDPSAALALMSADVRYTFAGQSALGGTRESRAGVEAWFGRLFRLLDSQWTVESVDVVGWPWKTTVYVAFEDRVQPRVGAPYVNQGVQVTTLRWGRAVEIHTFVDTARVDLALREMAEAGIEEASAAPIDW